MRADAADRLGRLVGPTSDGPGVLFVEWLEPLMPGGHWVPEQIGLAGGRSLLMAAGQHSVPHEWASAIAAKPEVIVLGPCGFTPTQTAIEVPTLATMPGWSDLPAVRAGQVWIVDGPAYFNRPGPRVIDGAEILSDLLAGRRIRPARPI